MTGDLLLRFSEEGVTARARMLWERAPATCAAVWDALPVRGRAHHAIYSGSEIALVLPSLVTVDTENATSSVHPGDVAFTWFEKGAAYGVDADFSEICWFYDVDAVPSMFEGPVPVNVFARIDDGDAFFAACRRMRMDGAKLVEIDRAA